MPVSPEYWARTLREHAGLRDVIPIDLASLIEWCSLEVAEIPVEGFLGLLLRTQGRTGILIKEGQSHGQRRFTIAHELGHFAIPHHLKQQDAYSCIAESINAPSQSAVEREANQFASELLMPRQKFGADIRAKLCSFGEIEKLSSTARYDVSLVACAIRWMEITREASALLCYEGGRLAWQFRSSAFRFALPARGSKPPIGSLVGEALIEGSHILSVESVKDVNWLADNGEIEDLLESAIGIPSFNRAYTLLTAVTE